MIEAAARPVNGATGRGRRPLFRLIGVFVLFAFIVAVPFVLWGEHFDALLGGDRLLGWLAEYRSTAWIMAIGLLVSDLLLPIPNTMVMAGLGAVYGPLLGGLISVTGNCLSGLLGYGLCRRFGRPAARRLLGEEDLAASEQLFARSGGPMIALSRWLPVIPEVVACMAGLARMRLRTFLLALICGSAPLGFTVATLGHAGSEQPLLTLVLCALLPLPIWYFVRRAFPAAG